MGWWSEYSYETEAFREEMVIPSAEEFLSPNRSSIQENRIGRPYRDASQYLETQFRLLREDLLRPYRNSVFRFRNQGCKEDIESNASCLREIHLYTSVKLLEIRPGFNGVEFGVSFNFASGSGSGNGYGSGSGYSLDLEGSKLLMPNTLLCISADGFQTFSFAVVSNRRDRALRNKAVGIRPADGHQLMLRKDVEYVMFESRSCYLEAYIHALKVLQKKDMEELHFIENLVFLESNVLKIRRPVLNWKNVCRFVDFLDESQEEAINHALSKNLAIIQGPPGTGKTFVGVRIVEALLASKRRGPILIVCYTNRAVDQFLEGICEMEKSLVRLGSRTQSSVLARFTLPEAMKKQNRVLTRTDRPLVPKHVRVEFYNRNSEKKTLARVIREKYKCFYERNVSRDELLDLSQQYKTVCEAAYQAHIAKQAIELRAFKVLGMTASFAARHNEMLRLLGSEIMIVEEAAEVTEAQILGCLNPSIKRLVLIGDHMQLRPIVANLTLARSHQLDVSLFERMVSSGVEYRALRFQRRMRPEISALLSGFYPDLKNHPCVESLPAVKRLESNLFFIDHENSELVNEDICSRYNPMEAEMVARFYKHLTKNCGYDPSEITVLCMYRSQLEEISKRLNSANNITGPRQRHNKHNYNQYHKRNRNCSFWDDESVVKTVDEFQGGESNIVLLSLVRNQPVSQNIGFVESVHRICVALSRAKFGLYIFGNAQLLSQHSYAWKEIIENLRSNGHVTTIQDAMALKTLLR